MAYLNGFTLTSPAGSFEFDAGTIRSHAKLIRDQITAAVHGVSMDGLRPPTPKTANKWIIDHMNGPAKDVPFEWFPV